MQSNPQTECPSYEFNEDDFQRIFGDGDEQKEAPVNLYKDWDESGHGRGDFR